MDSVESSISANAVVLTTLSHGACLTTTRKNVDRGINMQVTEVQHIVILAEHHRRMRTTWRAVLTGSGRCATRAGWWC